MNFKLPLVAMPLILSAFTTYATQTLSVTLQSPPPESDVTQTYDESTGIYNIHVNSNGWGTDNTRPAARTSPLTDVLPTFARTLAFEYKTTHACSGVKFYMYNVFPGTRTVNATIENRLEIRDEWITYRIPLGEFIDARTIRYGYKAGQYQDLIFIDLMDGADLQIRNIRYEEDEVPFNTLTITNGQTSLIEAENFNISAVKDKNYSNNQSIYVAEPYVNPVPGRFPIYAFTSVSYENIGDEEARFKLLQKKYQDMDAAGFTITESTAWPGINEAALFSDRSPNGVAIDLFEGTNLKMFLSAGLYDSNVITDAMKSSRLGGYHVVDEPHYTDKYSTNTIAAAGERARFIRNIDSDPNHMIYGNVFHINTKPSSIDAESYDQYVRGFVEQLQPGVLSYDYYAVRMFGDDARDDNPSNESNTRLMPTFFQNMEVISKLADYYGMTWWGFTRSMSSEYNYRADNPESSYRYPIPREDQMRVQVFSLLCYGAQGIEYWPYANCDGRDDALVNRDGTVNPVYYYAQSINKEVHALTWVFLGARRLSVGHTDAETPVGCIRLTKDMLPDGITDVTTNGAGMPVATLQNGKNVFLMAVNKDIWHEQTVSVTSDRAMKRVLPDGTTEPVTAGKHDYNLPVGGYVLYLVDENAPELENYSSPLPTYDYYRSDIDKVAFNAHQSASNGFYIADMGNHVWNSYNLITPDDEHRFITRDQAIENWGAWYAYTFDVAEDMTVDISIGHSVPWSEYGRVASVGAKPGVSYTIEGEPGLNWPKQYAASMTLSIDGETIIPAHSIRPSVPEVFDETGAEFNAILADKSRWIPTDGDENLYFWPKAGGDNDVTPVYNAAPDYRGVTLTAGTHRIVVRSNCYPWNFDAIKIAPADMSGIDNVTGDTAATLKATGVNGGILVETDAAFAIYNLSGVQVAEGQGSRLVDLAAGLYIVVADKTSVKVLVK